MLRYQIEGGKMIDDRCRAIELEEEQVGRWSVSQLTYGNFEHSIDFY